MTRHRTQCIYCNIYIPHSSLYFLSTLYSFYVLTMSILDCPLLLPPQLLLSTSLSVISNSIVGQYLRLSRERPGFESPLESFLFFCLFFLTLYERYIRDTYSFFQFVWGCSSDGRALALHARGTGIDTPHLHVFLFYSQHNTIYNLYNIHDKKILHIKKRQRQGSNLRSQRETAQQATALTTRPRCLLIYYTHQRGTTQT